MDSSLHAMPMPMPMPRPRHAMPYHTMPCSAMHVYMHVSGTLMHVCTMRANVQQVDVCTQQGCLLHMRPVGMHAHTSACMSIYMSMRLSIHTFVHTHAQQTDIGGVSAHGAVDPENQKKETKKAALAVMSHSILLINHSYRLWCTRLMWEEQLVGPFSYCLYSYGHQADVGGAARGAAERNRTRKTRLRRSAGGGPTVHND